ncbi:MAG: o-succinylbenzoate synthase [Caldilineales bacterium]|nr:o-succinylbenzoate synthase [Caldilineales bacterium]
MRIEQITLYKLAIPLVLPLETSMGRWNDQHMVLVRIQGEGLEGWGEAPVGVFPDYNHETSDTAVYVIKEFLAPPLLSLDIWRVDDLHPTFRRMRGHPFAKSGLEWATLDWLARSEGISLSQKLGGVRDRVPVGVSLGIEPDLGILIANVDKFVALGYQRIKMKIKPGWDVQVAEAFRARYPETPFMLDANNAYTLDDLAIMQALDAFEPMMIEQPLAYEDIYFHSLLQRQIHAPISLDESIHTPQHAQTAIALKACGNINIKPGRMGGPSAAVQVHDICQAAGMPVWHGGMLETGIGRAANLAMASLPNFTLPGDLSASDRYFHEDVVDPPAALNPDGTVDVPAGPGIGVDVRLDVIERFTREKLVIAAPIA